MKKITFLFILFISISFLAQVKGKITDTKNNPLSFVSVYLEKTVIGTTSNDNGDYILDLTKKGNHTIVFQFLGYKTLKKKVTITSFPFELNVKLEEENIVLDEVSISSKDNPANKIIRNAIANKDKNTIKLAKYTAKFYSRGLLKIKDAPEKFLGRSIGDIGGGLDSTRSGIIYLSETISEIAYQKKPKKFKEKIIASKVSGQDVGISFNRAEDSNLNLYDNSIKGFNNLVSPISTNAFSYYKYKLEGSFYDKNKKLINKIKIIPKRKGDKVFSGFIYIVEDDWAIYGSDLTTFGAQINVPIVNSIKLKQSYNYLEKINAWVLRTQTIDFDLQIFSFKPRGKFSYVYSDYNFKPSFTKNTFTNEVLTFAKEATKKDSVYWNEIRPVPLTVEEEKDYTLKDSIKIIRKSKKYLDSVDIKRNKFTLLSPVFGYSFRNSYEKWSFSFDSPIDKISFNTVQGFNSSAGFSYFKRENDKGKWWNAGVSASYGLSEKKIRPTFFFTKKWNNISKPRMSIFGGITTPQFNNREPISKLDNMMYSLLDRKNYMKVYEKTFARISYSNEIKNGIRLNSSLEYATRKPLFNTTDYSFVTRSYTYTSNNPLAPFSEHKIWTANIGVNIIFGQKYLSYPDSKFNIGNDKYPSLYLGYRKTFGADIPELNSNVLFANIGQEINFGNYGQLNYNMRSGLFLKKKDIAFMDFLHPNGNKLPFFSGDRLTSFGLLDYYKFSTNDKYAEMHVEHNFNGFILGKIPLINKLNLHLVGGAKALFTADRKPYTEYSVGLNNIGWGKWRFLRVDYVRSNYGGISDSGFLFGVSLFD